MQKNAVKYREMQGNAIKGREMKRNIENAEKWGEGDGAELHSQNIGYIIAHVNLNPVTPSHRKMQHTFLCTHIPGLTGVSDTVSQFPLYSPQLHRMTHLRNLQRVRKQIQILEYYNPLSKATAVYSVLFVI